MIGYSARYSVVAETAVANNGGGSLTSFHTSSLKHAVPLYS